MTTRPVTRRRLLRIGGGAAVLALAGCVGAPANDAPTDVPTTESVDDGHDGTDDHDDGGHDDGGHDEAIGDPVEHATVRMTSTDDGEHFEPHVVRVKPGGSVTWHLESGVHTTTAYHPDYDKPLRIPEGATPWDSGMLTEEGSEFEHTFETEGVYDYFCLPHESLGMIGSVIVGEPDAHDQPGLEPPQDSLPETAREKVASLNEQVNDALGHTHD